jgi:hypothetical protein
VEIYKCPGVLFFRTPHFKTTQLWPCFHLSNDIPRIDLPDELLVIVGRRLSPLGLPFDRPVVPAVEQTFHIISVKSISLLNI